MHHPGLAAMPDRNASGRESSRIRVALISERIVLRSDDDSGRQPAKVCGEHRADAGFGASRGVRDPLLSTPPDVVGCQAPTRGLHPRAGIGECQIGVGIYQDLCGRQWSALIAQAQAGKRGEVPARTVAHDDRRAPDAGARTPAGRHPPDDVHAIIDGRGPRVLRRSAEVDAQYCRVGLERQTATRPVVRLKIADRPHPAVEEHHQRLGRRRRSVEAGPHGRRTNRQILDPCDLRAWWARFDPEPLRAPQFRRSYSTGRRPRSLPNGVNEGGQFGIGKWEIDRFGHARQDASLTRTISARR